jgi:hypothetical protein
MQSIARNSITAVIIVLSLAACADAPTSTKSAIGRSPAASASVDPDAQLCRPCPPGQVCAAVCEEPFEGVVNPPGRNTPSTP